MKNVKACGSGGRVRAVFGDAKDMVEALEEPVGISVLDGPKAQYTADLPD